MLRRVRTLLPSKGGNLIPFDEGVATFERICVGTFMREEDWVKLEGIRGTEEARQKERERWCQAKRENKELACTQDGDGGLMQCGQVSAQINVELRSICSVSWLTTLPVQRHTLSMVSVNKSDTALEVRSNPTLSTACQSIQRSLSRSRSFFHDRAPKDPLESRPQTRLLQNDLVDLVPTASPPFFY